VRAHRLIYVKLVRFLIGGFGVQYKCLCVRLGGGSFVLRV
jgi:hypothetical protein